MDIQVCRHMDILRCKHCHVETVDIFLNQCGNTVANAKKQHRRQLAATCILSQA